MEPCNGSDLPSLEFIKESYEIGFRPAIYIYKQPDTTKSPMLGQTAQASPKKISEKEKETNDNRVGSTKTMVTRNRCARRRISTTLLALWTAAYQATPSGRKRHSSDAVTGSNHKGQYQSFHFEESVRTYPSNASNEVTMWKTSPLPGITTRVCPRLLPRSSRPGAE